MKKKTAILLAILVLILSVSFIGCDNGTTTSDGGGGINNQPQVGPNPRSQSINKFEAISDTSTGNAKIKYSFTHIDKDFYFIYLGELKNTPLFFDPAYYHSGMIEHKHTFTETKTETTAITETITESSQEAISIAETNTISLTTGGKFTQEVSGKLGVNVKGIGSAELATKTGIELSTSLFFSDTVQKGITKTKSLTNTIQHGTTQTYSTMQAREFYFTRDVEPGFYRWTYFAASDVYLYVIRDSKTNDIYYDFMEYVIPGSYFWSLDYSETASFNKSNLTNFEIDIAMLENLPKPALVLGNTERVEFTKTGDHRYDFDKGPATIEIYALGAGGGGQGGHSRTNYVPNPGNTGRGTGGAGGGGAATYLKFSVAESVTFNIVVGSGGSGGSARELYVDGMYGESGANGGNTTVRWGTNTLIAAGGNGGGGGLTVIGGNGGSADTAWPASNLDKHSVAGQNGTNGMQSGDIESRGGSAASISRGSEASFGGGGGAVRNATSTTITQANIGGGGAGNYHAPNRSGSSGGDGHVVIVVTY